MHLNPWQVLGVNRAMTPEEVHAAYIALAKKLHPDTKRGDHTKFTVVTGAYAVLKDAVRQRALLKLLHATAMLCTPCRGKGALFKAQGITGRAATTCNACGGSGFNIKEGKK